MAERSLNIALRKRLLNNEPFIYAHLVKFERPNKFPTINGVTNPNAAQYSYFTDAAMNISFDDGTLTATGGSNGAQTYIADKILKVGNYSETIQSKATGMTLELAAETLNNSVTSSGVNCSGGDTITFPVGIDLIDAGFREGDKIELSGGSFTVAESYVVTAINNSSRTFKVSVINDAFENQTNISLTAKIVSDELKGPLGETNDVTTLKSYHNRDVFVYKAFLDPDDYSIIGAPVLTFKGIIVGCEISDDPSSNLRVKWSLTSHWGDFAAVKGRITNDAIHRALNSEGKGQPTVSLRPEYATDLGFLHAEETINLLATYTAIEQEMRVKTKKKWGGLSTKTSTWMEDVEVEREVDLNFSLSSKFLPVVYGVQRVPGIPVFVDTKSNDPNNIYIAYAICEGEIGGIYDLYIDDNPTVCQNLEDFDDRTQTANNDNVEVFCRGRADLGQTLGGTLMSGNNVSGSNRTQFNYGGNVYGMGPSAMRSFRDNIQPEVDEFYTPNTALLSSFPTSESAGVTHGTTVPLTAPNTMRMTLHTGKIDQRSDNTLTSIGVTPKFKRQQDYFTGEEEYWGPQHRLLDTAYMVMDCEIAEDATTVPKVEYVVRGKVLDSFNYDYSYNHQVAFTSEAHTNFKVGDTVDIKRTSNNEVLNNDVFIIDKWVFTDETGTDQYRFRFSDAPDLSYTNGTPAITDFYMQDADGTNKWHMVTFNDTPNSGTVPSTLYTEASTVTSTSGTFAAGAGLQIDFGSAPSWLDVNLGMEDFSGKFNISIFGVNINAALAKITAFVSNNNTRLTVLGSNAGSEGADATLKKIVSTAQLQLATSAVATNDIYNGYEIELTVTHADGKIEKEKRTITDYVGSTKIAQLNTPWSPDFIPDPDNIAGTNAGKSYKYAIQKKRGQQDKRVSINPSIQLTDYLTAKTYGKGLDTGKDLDLSSFLAAARICDQKGTQTLTGTNMSATGGDFGTGEIYALTSNGATNGTVVAMGKVKSSVSGATSVVLEECFGKFTKKFMKNSHAYEVGDIVTVPGGYYRVTGTAGTRATLPSGSNPTGFTGPLSSFPIHKLTQSSGATTISSTVLTIVKKVGATFINPVEYSLYDCDDVRYWRYLGWNSHNQREVTRHQTNGTVNTSSSVFSNVNGFLTQFNGMLSYEAGKYTLRVAVAETAPSSDIATSSDTGYTIGTELEPRFITEGDIIGKISVKDGGPSKSFNTVSASISDPGSRFNGKAVSFYDSNYLRADKGVIKSGNINMTSISSYFNARINVENYMRQSRFNQRISFRLGPKSLLLLAGDVIAVTHAKWEFNAKQFRIENISFNQDCTASITASEYDSSFYTISNSQLSSVSNGDHRQGSPGGPGAPSSLSATANNLGGIDLAWTNSSGDKNNRITEIWSHPSNSAANRTLLATVAGSTAIYADSKGAKDIARYYWIRHGRQVTLTSGASNKTKFLYSAFHGPANATTIAPLSAFAVSVEGESNFINTSGTVTPSSIVMTTGRTNLTGNVSYAAVNNSSGSVTLTSASNTAVTLTSGNFGSATSVVITATVTSTSAERLQGADNTYTNTHTIRKVTGGVAGDDGAAGKKGITHFVYHQASASSAPTKPSADSYNISNNTFSNLTGGWATTPPTFAAGNTNKYWYSYFTATENTAGGNTCSGSNLVFQNSLQGIGFSGLVTFSSGNLVDGSSTYNPGSIINANSTTIDGGKITTGTITADRLKLSNTGAITIGSLTNDSGFTNDDVANSKTTASAAASAANSANKTAGSIGGLTLTSSKIHLGTGTHGNANTGFYVDSSGNMSLKDKLVWDGSTLAITGAITVTSGSNVAVGATANQTDSAAASAAATAANSADKTAGNVGGWDISSSAITSGNIVLNNSSNQIIISD